MSETSKHHRIRKVRTHISQNEGLIFEKSRPGSRAFDLPPSDVPEIPVQELLPAALLRTDDLEGMPEVAEPEVVRHYTRISTWNYGTDTGMFPLGSCTMKYNPKFNEWAARLDGFARTHPLAPEVLTQGNLRLIRQLEEELLEITGLAAISLQPAAGAHGEMTGVMMIRAALAARNEPGRKRVLIPDSAHGTNPASAVLCGFSVDTIPSNERGLTDMAVLEKRMDDSVAAIMLTNPNTLGMFEENIEKICALVHERGGYVYMDGANMNAMCGVTRPGDMGIDVMHLNLHKTFSTPHGGGGPGCGPVLVAKGLEPFLPYPVLKQEADGQIRLDYDRPQSIGRVRFFLGNFGMMVRALGYIRAHGPDGLRMATETAVLNANYVRHHLSEAYDMSFDGPILHEVVFSDKRQQQHGVKNADIAKRLIDYGFHPPTMSFPLIAPGAIMIEPTESESREELDLFIDAMKSISAECAEDPELVKSAPHWARLTRLDEVSAARNPVLRWKAGK
ncbi:MAG: aminomethyl-transferring glycine dehydrogenase subunit GcvPB [Blastocatellia bacterium]|nr:aminomethyl-transferring glycine dehydrogenase subunit GcvPB [Blastocatellia bacterium]